MSFFRRQLEALKAGKNRRILFFLPLAFSILVVLFLASLREPPKMEVVEESITKARYVKVEKTTIIPRIIGYGFVRPENVWNGVAQVSGEVVYRHADLRVGSSLAAGTEILRIDPTDYELAVQRLKANVAANQARLQEIEMRAKNTQASLIIEERALELKQQDLIRKQTLLKRGAISQAGVDQEERAVLAQSQSVQSLRNQTNLIPAQKQGLEAEAALASAQLAQAEIDLSRTSVRLPFDGRIASVNIETSQVVSTGQIMVIADSLARSEVDAQIPLDKFMEILPQSIKGKNQFEIFLPTTNEPDSPHQKTTGEKSTLSAVVRLQTGNFSAAWPARVVRLTDQVDPQTRTVGVVVAIDETNQPSDAPARPPLTKNMYVEVEIRGEPQHNQLLVPRAAIHQGRLYIADSDNRLVIRKAQTAFIQGNLAVLSKDATADERVIVSDLIPAIPGMKLDMVFDQALADKVTDQASGMEPIK